MTDAEKKAAITARRVYVVHGRDEIPVLVRASSAHNAIMHVFGPHIRVATFDDAGISDEVEEAK